MASRIFYTGKEVLLFGRLAWHQNILRCDMKVRFLNVLQTVVLFICVIFTAAGIALAEDATESTAVVLDDNVLFNVASHEGGLWPQERARIISKRILDIAEDITIPVDEIDLKYQNNQLVIATNGRVIMTITKAEAGSQNLTPEELASQRLVAIRQAVATYRQKHATKNLVIQLVSAVLLTGLLIFLLRQLNRLATSLRQLSPENGVYRFLRRYQGDKLIPLEKIRVLFHNLIAITASLVKIIVLYFYLYFFLGIFPWTRQYSEQLLNYILSFVRIITKSVVGYLPNALTILFIILLSRYLLKFLRFLFDQIKYGRIKISGFYTEWADPTYKIVRFLVLTVMIVSIFPYIPGSQSLAFKGVSVFLGVLLSLGSTSAVANIIAGIALTYTRAFNVGDRVKIGDNEGDIMERSLLATRIRTIKNVDITLPNSIILNSPIINYSSAARDTVFILHTRITLSYATPRKQAEELLIQAALATRDILPQPSPYVYHVAFNDFAIVYELNACTLYPNRKEEIYSELHKNITDMFNAAGIEIMTAHYHAIRNGSQTCIPPQAHEDSPNASHD